MRKEINFLRLSFLNVYIIKNWVKYYLWIYFYFSLLSSGKFLQKNIIRKNVKNIIFTLAATVNHFVLPLKIIHSTCLAEINTEACFSLEKTLKMLKNSNWNVFFFLLSCPIVFCFFNTLQIVGWKTLFFGIVLKWNSFLCEFTNETRNEGK